MSVKSLNGSMSSLVDDDLLVGDMMEADDLLRRLSTYATLRPGDLPALVGSSRSHPGPKLLASSQSLLLHEDRVIRERRDSAGSDGSAESDNSDKKPLEEELEKIDIVVRGKDIGEHPVEYTVSGIWPHEMPVIGLYVDPRILPGFRYRVRRLGTDRYLFHGRALTLQSIGLGYGKRLTFEGERLNFNDNYFWSDSEPLGFAFSLEALRPGDTLAIYGSGGSGVVGEVRVERVEGHQPELSTEVLKGDVIKRARVTATCSVTYFVPRHHGRLNVKLQSVERVSGEATVVRRKGQRQAALDCVYGVQLDRLPGTCTLQNEA